MTSILIALAVVAAVTALERQLEHAIDAAARAVATLVSSIREPSMQVAQKAASQRDGAVRGLAWGSERSDWPGFRAIGSVLYLIILLVLGFADAGLLYLTFDAIGFGSGAEPLALIQRADLLMVLSATVAGVFFASLWLELRGCLPDLAPWCSAPEAVRSVVEKLAISCLLILVLIAVVLAGWRAHEVLPTPVPPQELGDMAANVAVALLTGIVALAAGLAAWGGPGVIVVAYLLLTTSMWIAFSLLQACLRLVSDVTNAVAELAKAALVRPLAAAGRLVWNWLAKFEFLVRTFHIDAVREVRAAAQAPALDGATMPENAPPERVAQHAEQ